ncbi:CBS domain-containing protein [Mycobacterium heckeshornense]|uniref:Hypoxic response protein 1 n=1 Tax=Mycobacterium heckeshornense TaxID=110505 RepID=A0A2G8B6E9_9MYCO|nr:CBS domain-containing protein [Mycobacterium heckeshornense]KMV20913.1 hypoxic response protein 1 [Mycobacterium heckeshornense]MCV7034942.1 CBS domain-containing protein [Mycobacterium heckeshornense]PIJ33236.1 CBS domain-containing protein [Mycobacterium heckeshornense]BCO34972.1 hypoxic response protein 1 [Mycobacterium heckeshornense]BCQ08140.1 hypoxic response protein 1 [Mycobacterium heckeshornense]
MTTARDIMTTDVTCIDENEALTAAAQHMRDLDVGALPIRGNDGRLRGMITDRDITIKCVAEGLDPTTTTAGQLAQGNVYSVEADASAEEILNMMEEHQIRRLPVLENNLLIGIIAEADITRHMPEYAIVRFVKAIYSPKALTRH